MELFHKEKLHYLHTFIIYTLCGTASNNMKGGADSALALLCFIINEMFHL